jgi:hypothetical protein
VKNGVAEGPFGVHLLSDRHARVSVGVDGPSAVAFAQQPGGIVVFLDERIVWHTRQPEVGMEVEVPLPADSAVHRLTVNWASEYGPVAASSCRVRVAAPSLPSGARLPAGGGKGP